MSKNGQKKEIAKGIEKGKRFFNKSIVETLRHLTFNLNNYGYQTTTSRMPL
jgi:hypothetical protein